jgi:hypothetical protein
MRHRGEKTWIGEENVRETVSAKLQRALSKDEIEEMWREAPRGTSGSLPNFLFEVNGDIVTVEMDPRHIPPRSIQEVKTAFQIEVHRKYGEKFEVRWLDISQSDKCSIHRSTDSDAKCAIHNVFLTGVQVDGDPNPPGPGHIRAWLCPISQQTMIEADM